MSDTEQCDNWIKFQESGQDFYFFVNARADTIQTDMLRMRTFYEVGELDFLRRLLPPEGSRIVDVGANIGNHTVYFDRICRASLVVPIEPNEDVAHELRRNVARNDCRSVDLSHLGIAAGKTSGSGVLFRSDQDIATLNRGGTRLRTTQEGLPVRRLDEIVTGPFDLIKIDVEGMALDVLEGAERLLDGPTRPLLFVEIEAAQEARFKRWLGLWGYTVRASFMMYSGLTNFVCVPGSNIPAGQRPGSAEPIREEAMTVGMPPYEPAALGLTAEKYRELRNVFDVQSCVFACEIMPWLWQLYPSGLHNLSLLDVGPRTAAGTGLLQYVHHPESFSRIKLSVTAIDIDGTYVDYARAHFPDVEYLVGDIFDPALERRFDVVLCSHTLEHVPDPAAFLMQLRRLARQWVIIACPFEERELIPGHVNSLGWSFFEEQGAHFTHVYRSLTWHSSMACVAAFKGMA